MSGKPIERLDDDKENKAVELAADGKMYKDIAKVLGFSKDQFNRYRAKYPEFNTKLNEARDQYCDYLEDELLEIPLKYDSKTADVLSKNIIKLLQYRNPKRYGDKIDMNVHASMDIAGSLDRAEQRLVSELTTNVITIAAKKIE